MVYFSICLKVFIEFDSFFTVTCFEQFNNNYERIEHNFTITMMTYV